MHESSVREQSVYEGRERKRSMHERSVHDLVALSRGFARGRGGSGPSATWWDGMSKDG